MISYTFYREHRRALMARLADGLIFIKGGTAQLRNGDVHLPFRQDSHFLYLTGVEAPDYALLLDPRTSREILLIPRVDDTHRVWLGDVPSRKASRDCYEMKEVAYLDELPKMLSALRARRRVIYGDRASLAAVSSYDQIAPLPRGALARQSASFEEAMSELRVIKSAGEVELLLRANRVSRLAHIAAMQMGRPGRYEYEVQATFEAVCKREGLPHLAYPSIVASGPHSAVLHYHQNNDRLKSGSILLIDAGAECRGYASDITRVFPVSGQFSSRAREVYAAVLAVQKQSIAMLRPGIPIHRVHEQSCRLVLEGLKSLGVVHGDLDSLFERKVDRVFYPHGLSHTLGLDVHDVTGGKKRKLSKKELKEHEVLRPARFSSRLEPGFVVTIEPGIYFIPALLNAPEVQKRYRDCICFDRLEPYIKMGGVRIEDDLLITETGSRNLTSVPKEIDEIEAICSGS